ncbi:MAG: glycoside hydrolase family 5 protein [Treponema sp.]|nr:glycoside hydrolase family 5 protein [Treponema sp.]
MKKLAKVLIAIAVLFSFGSCASKEAKKVADEARQHELLVNQFVDLTYDSSFTPQNRAQQIVYDMQFGWNLGNTFDALPWNDPLNAGNDTEKAWGQPITTMEMIKGLKALGINTIRIPISWHNHLEDENYTISRAWMGRIQQIVDWACEEDMYVIINIHHDNYDSKKKNFGFGKGFYPTEECKDESLKFLTSVWRQVSETFKDYSDKLIFEVLNEPRLQGDKHEWNYYPSCASCKEAMNVLMEFNQACLDTIRASGGNNANRLVMIPSLAASPDHALHADFKLPVDSAENGLAVSVHMYTPYQFAMGVPGGEVFTESHKGNLTSYFNRLNEKFISKGIPVVIGEMGATNKDNLEDRAAWFGFFVQRARKYGMTACVWDNGVAEPSKTESEKYGYYNRLRQEWYFPLLMDVALKASSIGN